MKIGKTARRRKEELQKREDESEEKEVDDVEETEKKEVPPKKDWKYYFNRFRYYHYYIAEKIDSYIATLCAWVINLQLYLMGFRGNEFGETEESGFNFAYDAD